jgi:1,4-alpha-glucan branching enzyme
VGQFTEWNFEKEIEWFMINYEYHKKLNIYIKVLNEFYLNNSELWEIDYSWSGFKWISNDNFEQNIIAFKRINKSGDELIIVINFSPVERKSYSIGTSEGSYTEVFNSDKTEFGGTGSENSGMLITAKGQLHGYDSYISLTVPPLSVIFLKKDKNYNLKMGGKVYEIS